MVWQILAQLPRAHLVVGDMEAQVAARDRGGRFVS